MTSNLPATQPARGIPTAADLPEQGEALPPGDAFLLLSKPTLELTHEDMKKISADLRAKRVKFLQGKADNPGRKAPAVLTEDEKKARGGYVKGLLGNLKI